MSRQVQIRRGTTAEHAAFTGAQGELSYNTTTKRLHSHDGSTVGGAVHALLAEMQAADTAVGDAAAAALAARVATLAGTGGAATVGNSRSATGALAAGVDEELEALPLDAVVNFGADPTGATNTTTALLTFYTAAIAHGAGHIPSGRYKITRSVLAFDNGHVEAEFPVITTDAGVEFFVDSVTPGTVGPLLAFTNGTASSGAGAFWKGGYHGDIKLTGLADFTLGYANDAEHGLSLRGIQEVHFGLIYGFKLGGSAVWVEEKLYSTTNPDPYHVALGSMVGVKAEYCSWAVQNDNWVGCTHWDWGTIRAIGCRSGALYGIGTDCVAGPGSCSANAGWTVDDGAFAATTGGTPSRFTLRGGWEIDGVQYGFRVNRCDTFHAPQVRFVYRRNHTSANPTTYWPAKTIDFCSGTSPAVRDFRAGLTHRVEASSGAVLGDLGTFLAFNSTSALSDCVIDNVLFADNSGLGATQALLVTTPPTGNGRALVLYEGRPLFNSTWKVGCLVRSSTADSVPNTGYAAAGSKITFGSELYDLGGYYDTANSWFTVPYSGLYRFSGQICLTVAAGTRVRMAIATDTAGVIALQKQKNSYQTNAGAEHHQIDGVVSLTAGQRVFLMADQNTAGAVAMSTPVSATADLTWSIEAL